MILIYTCVCVCVCEEKLAILDFTELNKFLNKKIGVDIKVSPF